MFLQDLIDTLVIVVMFGLRVGVPIALTLAFGYWLEKKLAPREAPSSELEKPRVVKASGKIIQLHCWDFKHCDQTKRAQCAAFKHAELPCWLALQAEGAQVREECFTCALYKTQQMAA